MAQVPFIMYFNDQARKIYYDKYINYKKLSNNNNISLLSQLPFTIFDLLGNSKYSDKINGRKSNNNIILTRDFPSYTSYINLTNSKINTNAKEQIHESVEILKIKNSLNISDNIDICYHRSNTFAKSIRGSKITTCLELDIIINDNQIYVNHPPQKEKINIESISPIVKNNNLALWLDAKNLDNNEKCLTLNNFLSKNSFRKVLIEFPSYISDEKYNLKKCFSLLNAKKNEHIYTSYYVPTSKGLSCVKSYEISKNFKNKNCSAFFGKLINVLEKNNFSDISFNYRLYDIIRKKNELNKYNWNTWSIKYSKYFKYEKNGLNMIILNNSDKNNY